MNKTTIKILLLAGVIAALAAFFASANPDGLEKVAENLGFIDKGLAGSSLMTDYAMPFISQPGLSTAVAGIAGILLTFGLFWGLARIFKKQPGTKI